MYKQKSFQTSHKIQTGSRNFLMKITGSPYLELNSIIKGRIFFSHNNSVQNNQQLQQFHHNRCTKPNKKKAKNFTGKEKSKLCMFIYSLKEKEWQNGFDWDAENSQKELKDRRAGAGWSCEGHMTASHRTKNPWNAPKI